MNRGMTTAIPNYRIIPTESEGSHQGSFSPIPHWGQVNKTFRIRFVTSYVLINFNFCEKYRNNERGCKSNERIAE